MAQTGLTQDLKQDFINELGEDSWDDGWKSLLSLSPEIFSASVKLSAVPKKKKHLSPKVQSLVSIAVDSAATHLYIPGVHTHIKAALKAGATIEEIMEVLELTSTLGIHACNIGVPLLVEVMREEGLRKEDEPFSEEQEALKEDFTKKRGYWHRFWEDFLRLDPEFFKAYLDFSSVPWVKDLKGDGKGGGALDPKTKELIYCAFDCAATHLYVPGLKLHMRNALGYGAAPQEIVEVMEIATLLSLHTLHAAAPILAQYASR